MIKDKENRLRIPFAACFSFSRPIASFCPEMKTIIDGFGLALCVSAPHCHVRFAIVNELSNKFWITLELIQLDAMSHVHIV